jgi:DNA-binding NarL/FixJ family response regulator
MSIRVTIIEDNPHLRKGLSALIESAETLVLAGAFADANSILRDVKKTQTDVVLMDINLPGISGIEALQQLKHAYPEIKVIMQTVFENDDKIFASICAGANGYIIKNSTPEIYLQAVEDAYHGGAPMTPSIATRVLRMFQMQMQQKPVDATLTERERAVLEALVAGKSYKIIAADLSISYTTVRFHMKNIYEKLHVQSMTEAVAKAIQNKLV